MTTLRATAVPPIYRAVVAEIERRQRELGWTNQQIDDAAGTNDGYFAKAVRPETKTGRMARWESVDLIVSALFPEGFTVAIRSENDAMLPARSIDHGINDKAREIRHWRHSRHFKDLGAKGNAARLQKVPRRRRKAIARKAARARWRKVREAQAKARVELNKALYRALEKQNERERGQKGNRNTSSAVTQPNGARSSRRQQKRRAKGHRNAGAAPVERPAAVEKNHHGSGR